MPLSLMDFAVSFMKSYLRCFMIYFYGSLRLPQSLQAANIDSSSSYKPIALLYSDQKTLSHTLDIGLKLILPLIINGNQTGLLEEVSYVIM